MQTARSVQFLLHRSIPARLVVALLVIAAGVGAWFLADGYLGSTQTFASARELVATAAREGVRCGDASLTDTRASCLVEGHFTSFRVFDSRRDKREMITAIRVVRRDGGGGNHLVIGDRWAVITASERVAHRLGAALAGRVDLAESHRRGDGPNKKR